MAVRSLEPPAELLEEWDWDAAHPSVLPEVPDWLLEAPGSVLEPTCDCCAQAAHHLGDDRMPVLPSAEFWAVPGVTGLEAAPERVVVSVGDAVRRIEELVAQLSAVEVPQLSAGQALGEAEALVRVQHQLRVAQLVRACDVRDRKLHEHLGYRSVSAWQVSTAPDTPSSERTLASRLDSAAHLAAALQGGRVSFTTAALIGKALATVRGRLDRPDGLIDGQPAEPTLQAVGWHLVELICQDRYGLGPDQASFLATLESTVADILCSGGGQRDRLEQLLVLLGTHLRGTRALRNALETVVLQLLPSTLEERERRAHDKRAVALCATTDGTWELSGTLTPEVGEQLFTALAAEARRDPANPLDTHARERARALHDHGDGPPGPDGQDLVPRGRSKRLHDAFGRLLARYLADGLGGTSSKVPVQIAVTVSARAVDGVPGAPPPRGASGQPLARSLVRRWWCDAHVTTFLLSRGWKPLGVVHTARTVTATELVALRTQFDGRCPGIDCCQGSPDPLTPLVPHHVRRYGQHGHTSLDETLLVCERLHQDLHVGKRTLRLRDGRVVTEEGFLHSPPYPAEFVRQCAGDAWPAVDRTE